MITSFGELRVLISERFYPNDSFWIPKKSDRFQYAQTMMLIQIAQELNEIKQLQSDRNLALGDIATAIVKPGSIEMKTIEEWQRAFVQDWKKRHEEAT